jgi:hypothetical protein
MLKKLIYLCIVANLALLLQSCCNDYDPIHSMQIVITSIPKQDNIVVWGIKNGKELVKVTLYKDSYNNPSNVIQNFSFPQSLDMTVDNSTLAIQYIDKNQVLKTDTVTVSYTRSANYESLCGVSVRVDNVKLEKSTAKLPVTITLNR